MPSSPELAWPQSAWIDDGERRFVARLERASPCESAVTRLIQGIYDREPGSARGILRHRILATAAQPSEMCWGMVKLAAKRMKCGVSESALAPGRELIELGPVALAPGICGEAIARIAGESPMALARRLAASIRLKGSRWASDRPIAAVLESAEGAILGWAVNSSASNKTLHAEVNLIQSYCRKHGKLPRGSRIHVTLKSCKMCAGMIWSAAEDPLSIRVFFDQDDPGPKARRTVLNPGSFERVRAAKADGRAEALHASVELAGNLLS